MTKRWIINVGADLLASFQEKVARDHAGVSQATIGRVLLAKYTKGEINVIQDEIEAHHGWAVNSDRVDIVVEGEDYGS